MMKTQKTMGIYGGTFSPPHLGHVNAGLSFLRQLDLDLLTIMPARIAPHKADSGIDPLHRLNMANLAFQNAPEYGKRLIISDFEINRPEISYTVNTLRHFSEQGYRLYFLCGTDMFLNLDRWRAPEAIFYLATIAYIRREGESPEMTQQLEDTKRRYEKLYDAKCVEIHTTPIEVSSSEIRELLTKGEDASHLLPVAVYDYIRAHGLYLPDEKGSVSNA